MRFFRPVTILLALLLLPVTAAVQAVTVKDLYTGTVEVADKGPDAREKGVRAALEKVLVRVSGSAAVTSNPEVEPLLDNPSRYVQEYRYEAIEQEEE